MVEGHTATKETHKENLLKLGKNSGSLEFELRSLLPSFETQQDGNFRVVQPKT